jgi:hypothetical protein
VAESKKPDRLERASDYSAKEQATSKMCGGNSNSRQQNQRVPFDIRQLHLAILLQVAGQQKSFSNSSTSTSIGSACGGRFTARNIKPQSQL